ncbi:MAG: zinc ribbon domain-containing protein [Nitrososphaerota archaeon]|nr:zinc ribbon domain-containing protein [Nitrososphaerota archaeon]
MPFCPECGQRIRADQTVCSGCRGNLQTLLTVEKGIECPRCGETVGTNFSYCSRCGFLLAQENPLQELPKKRKNAGQAPPPAAIIVMILVVIAAFAATGFLRSAPPGTVYPITISQVDIHYSFIGAATSYAGSIADSKFGPYYEYSNSQFILPVSIPPNPTPQPLQVSSIIVATTGFTLVSYAPSSGVLISPGSSTSLMLTIRTPPGTYDGVLYIIIQMT